MSRAWIGLCTEGEGSSMQTRGQALKSATNCCNTGLTRLGLMQACIIGHAGLRNACTRNSAACIPPARGDGERLSKWVRSGGKPAIFERKRIGCASKPPLEMPDVPENGTAPH